jgi:NhaP-type Na+/H+ or K+/H+ antiporter
MGARPFSEEQISVIEAEFEKWQEFLNFVLGMFSFNAALACLALNSPRLSGGSAILFFFVAAAIGTKRFPPFYKQLRDKPSRTPQEEIWFLGLKSKFLGLAAMFKNFPLYWIGIATLACVATGIFKNI